MSGIGPLVGLTSGLLGGGSGGSGSGATPMAQAQPINTAANWQALLPSASGADMTQMLLDFQTQQGAQGSAADPTGQGTPKMGGGQSPGMSDGSWSSWNG